MLLFLKNNNLTIVISDFPYELIPTTYYHHCERLKVEVYDLDYVDKNGNGHYKLMETRDK